MGDPDRLSQLFINVLDKSESNANLSGNATLVRTQLDAVLKF